MHEVPANLNWMPSCFHKHM